jgi:uncharacterized protein
MAVLKRHIENVLAKFLFRGKALIVIGARQVGKSTMFKNMLGAKEDVLWLNADENEVRNRLVNPTVQSLKGIFGDYKTVVIDEVQRIENSGLLMKLAVDNFKDVQFLATGSSALEISDSIFEPMTGRAFVYHLYPFGLSELYPKKSPFEIEQFLGYHLVFGMYPEVCVQKDIAETILRNLSEQYLYKDVLVWKEIRKPELLDKLLKLLAYQMGAEVSVNELANQLKVKSETIETYIDLLEKAFVVFRLKAFSTNPRKEVSKMSKILFWDNGIRNAIIGNFNALANRNDHGQLFENFVISERMKVNALYNPGVKSFFWRNYNQAEVDYVEVQNENIDAFEIKWSTLKKHRVSKAFTNMYPNAQAQVLSPENFYGAVNSKSMPETNQ